MTNNFTKSQITCKCGCGYNDISMILMHMLQDMRNKYGKPIYITSGCRCRIHNASVGGKLNSAHLTGLAVDIAFANSQQLYILIELAIHAGFKRIGINFKSKFIHLDIDLNKPNPCIFNY